MISVIGTGSMGSAIAEGLLSAEQAVTVFNRSRGKALPLANLGAAIAETAAEAIQGADLVVLVLTDGKATREVLFAEENAKFLSGKKLMNVAHTGAAEIIEMSRSVSERGGRLSEVNVTVYPHLVRRREGHFNVASQPEDRDVWLDLFRNLGRHVHDVGAVGNASHAELAVWLSYVFNAISLAYSAVAFDKLGLPSSALTSAVTDNPSLRITNADLMLPQMTRRVYERNTFTVDNFAYSIDLIKSEAAAMGLPTTLFQEIHRLYKRASDLGFGDQDVSAVYEALALPGG